MEADQTSEEQLLIPNKEQNIQNGPDVEIKVYKRRWYLVLLFSVMAGTQGCIWNTWGPLATSANYVFGWSDQTIALLINWGPISYLLGFVPFTWMMDVKGLRWASLTSAALIALGAGLRCITSSTPAATWLVHIGQMLNGLPGPLVMGGGPVFSAAYFPVEQRSTATAILSVFGGIGITVSFIIGPLVVPERVNSTDLNSTLHNGNDTNHALATKDMMYLMYGEFAWAALIFLLILIYFPAKPPKPPSKTAAVERVAYISGMKQILRNSNFWIITAVYAIPIGVFNCWSTVLPISLKPLGLNEQEAGWLAFWQGNAATVIILLTGILSDIFKRRMRLMIIISYFVATVFYMLYLSLFLKWIPYSLPLLYVLYMIFGPLLTAPTVLFYELGCDVAYPVSETLANVCMTTANNIAGLIFLLILMIPNIATGWINWFQFGCLVLALPIIFFIKENYTRLDIDTGKNK